MAKSESSGLTVRFPLYKKQLTDTILKSCNSVGNSNTPIKSVMETPKAANQVIYCFVAHCVYNYLELEYCFFMYTFVQFDVSLWLLLTAFAAKHWNSKQHLNEEKKGVEVALNAVNMVVGARRAAGCFPSCWATGNFALVQTFGTSDGNQTGKHPVSGSCVGSNVRDQRSNKVLNINISNFFCIWLVFDFL